MQDVSGGNAEAESKGDDAARACTSNQIKMVGYPRPSRLLDLREECGWKGALKAAPVDGKNAPQKWHQIARQSRICRL
jgi:hypothetical protein